MIINLNLCICSLVEKSAFILWLYNLLLFCIKRKLCNLNLSQVVVSSPEINGQLLHQFLVERLKFLLIRHSISAKKNMTTPKQYEEKNHFQIPPFNRTLSNWIFNCWQYQNTTHKKNLSKSKYCLIILINL